MYRGSQPHRGGTRQCGLYRPYGTGFRFILNPRVTPVARIVFAATRLARSAKYIVTLIRGRKMVRSVDAESLAARNISILPGCQEHRSETFRLDSQAGRYSSSSPSKA